MVMKFRMVKFARIPSYNELFSGDPVWATLNVGGKGVDGRSMVTFNTKTMTLCVLLGVTTTLSAAAYLQHRQVKKCNSSVQELTLLSVFYTLSTAV